MQLSGNNIQTEIKQYFHYITNYYCEESNFTLKASYLFRFSFEGIIYNWHLCIDKESIHFDEGEIQNPDVIISTTYFLWLKISSGEKNAIIEYFKRSYTIKGSLMVLLSFNAYFGSIVKKSRRRLSKQQDSWELYKKRSWIKPDSVLVINASPRMENGFTYRYLKPFIEGISSRMENIELVNLYKSDFIIEPCRGCERCWKKSGECILNDSGSVLIQKILESKLTLFAMPLYVDSMPAKLKSLLDRFFIQTKPEFEIGPDGLTRHPVIDQRERYFALFSVCGFPEIEHFKPLVDTFKDIGRNFHAPIIANILRPGSQFIYLNPLMMYKRKIVEKWVYLAGQELVDKGKISKKNLKAISNTGKVSMDEWRYYTNMYWADFKKEES